MRRRRIALFLALFIFAFALLSGTLLILHTDHECHLAICPVCILLDQNFECFLGLFCIFTGIRPLFDLAGRYLVSLSENRFIPDWTPVRLKVKLLD